MIQHHISTSAAGFGGVGTAEWANTTARAETSHSKISEGKGNGRLPYRYHPFSDFNFGPSNLYALYQSPHSAAFICL